MPAAKKKTTARKTTAKKKATTRKTTTARKKTTAKKTTARKTTARKTTAKKKSNVTPIRSGATTALKEALTKSQQFEEIANVTGVSKKDVKAVMEAQEVLIMRCIKKGSVGQITLPIGLKIEVKVKPARKARKGINPFTGEEMMFKAKPASRVVKVRPLKKVKDAAN